MASITSSGIEIDSFNDLFDSIATTYKEIYGEDINIDQDTTDGQKISIFVKAYRDLQELGVSVYNSLDPDTAVGTQLHKLLKLCGISRSAATKSTVDIQIVTDREVTLTGYEIKDDLNQIWVIATNQTLPTGTTIVSFKAKEWGAITAQANTITTPETIVIGVISVTNPNSATMGVEEESDYDLKIRRQKSVSLPSVNTIEGLQAKILNLNGVADCVIHENDTDDYDVDLDLNSHSIWVLVDGGIDIDIINTIGLDKMAGTGLKGTQSGDYTGLIARQDGTFREKIISVYYDRPTIIEIYIKMNVKSKTIGAILDLDAIKNALTERLFYINENATVTELYSFIYHANTNFIASDLELSKDDITYYNDVLTAGYDEKLLITTAKITITEI